MEKILINSNFLFLNEQITPFEKLFLCDTKLQYAKDLKRDSKINSINENVEIVEFEDFILVIALPSFINTGKLFTLPSITKDSTYLLCNYISELYEKPVQGYYNYYNNSKNKDSDDYENFERVF